MNDNDPTVTPMKPRLAGAGDAREKFLINPRDNAAACRERADADRKEAATLTTANARRLLESSAESWTVRAELLQRLEDKFEARKADRAANVDDGTA